jgi:hypothetical protein
MPLKLNVSLRGQGYIINHHVENNLTDGIGFLQMHCQDLPESQKHEADSHHTDAESPPRPQGAVNLRKVVTVYDSWSNL